MHVVHSLEVGGMERGLVSILRCMDARRGKHVVCTMRAAGPLADELPGHVRVESLDIGGRNRLAALKLAAAIKRSRPHIIHARNWNTWLDCVTACRLVRMSRPFRTPFPFNGDRAGERERPPVVEHDVGVGGPLAVLGFHGLETDGGFTVRQRRRAGWLRLPRHRFTTVSHTGRRQLRSELGVAPERITLLTNGVDVSRFTPPDQQGQLAARAAIGLDPDEFAVVMVGALVPVKNHNTAIGALEQCTGLLGRCRLVLVGDGPLRSALEAQARQLPEQVRVTFLGLRSEVVTALHAADLLVLSSGYEQMSNAILEAMACGLPIIATDVGDNARIVEHQQCGLIVPQGDTRALGQAIQKLRDDRSLGRRLGQAGRRRVMDHHCIEDTAEAYIRYYESLLQILDRERQPCAESRA